MAVTPLKVLVTGGSGILGHYVIDRLLADGHRVTNADAERMGGYSHSGNVGKFSQAAAAVAMRERWGELPRYLETDVADYGAVVSAMDGADAVVALAARPTPFNYVEEDIVRTNVQAVWNVCRAAEQLGVERVVLGSSYNAIGAQATAMARWAPRELKPPARFPLDGGSATRAEDPYSVAKWLGEQIADAFARRNPAMSIASLRFTGVWDDAHFSELHRNPISDPWHRCQGFWAYVNIVDAAAACGLALAAPAWRAHERLFINAADTMLAIPTAEALSAVYPEVPVEGRLGRHQALFDIGRAEQLLGWQPTRSWRDERYGG